MRNTRDDAGIDLDDPALDLDSLPLTYWYTAGDAAAALSRKSKRNVRPDYLRSLIRAGVPIRTKKMGTRSILYLRYDVDRYTVEARGTKSGRAQQARRMRQKEEG